MKLLQLSKVSKTTIIKYVILVLIASIAFLTSCSQKYYAQPNQITFTFKEKPTEKQLVEIVDYFKVTKHVDISGLEKSSGELVYIGPVKVGPTPGPRPKPVTFLNLKEIFIKFNFIKAIDINFNTVNKW